MRSMKLKEDATLLAAYLSFREVSTIVLTLSRTAFLLFLAASPRWGCHREQYRGKNGRVYRWYLTSRNTSPVTSSSSLIFGVASCLNP